MRRQRVTVLAVVGSVVLLLGGEGLAGEGLQEETQGGNLPGPEPVEQRCLDGYYQAIQQCGDIFADEALFAFCRKEAKRAWDGCLQLATLAKQLERLTAALEALKRERPVPPEPTKLKRQVDRLEFEVRDLRRELQRLRLDLDFLRGRLR